MNLKYAKYALLALSCIAASCDSDHKLTEGSDDLTIRFEPPFTYKSVARAMGDIDNSNIYKSKFKVWGTATTGSVTTNVFNGTEIYYNGGTWTYQTPQQWDASANYYFAAIAPTDGISEANLEYADYKFMLKNIPLSTLADYGYDYLVSRRLATTYYQSGGVVQLDFQHILSRLKTHVKYTSDDDQLKGITLKKVSLNLPIGDATYLQADPDGPSADDQWTWHQNGELEYILLDTDTRATKDAFEQLGNGFFVAPTPDDIKVTMNLAYDVELNYNGEIMTLSVDKHNVEIPNLTSFRQGYISNLWLNIKPTGNDYSYIEINVSQEVAEHEPNNGIINEKSQTFLLNRLWQEGSRLYAQIDALGNEVTDATYFLTSILDANSDEQLCADNAFSVESIEDGQYVLSSYVNALLDADAEYAFTITDRMGNSQTLAYAPEAHLGGASMQWTVEISADKEFAIPFPNYGFTSYTYRVDWGDGKGAVTVPKGSTLSSDDSFYHKYASADTYTITITSAISDPDLIQIDRFAFSENRTGTNGAVNTKLVKLDTPLLNLGEDGSKIFYNCQKLSSIPTDLFIFNADLITLERAFSNTALTTIPKGLFDPLINIEHFREIFYGCTALTTIPDGLFGLNLKAYDFRSAFYQCTSLILNPNMFLSSSHSLSSRFVTMSNPLDFSRTFYQCGLYLSSSQKGTAPDLWNYTYGAGYTWRTNNNTNSYNPFYGLSSNAVTNYSTIPSIWIDGDATGTEGYVSYPYSD